MGKNFNGRPSKGFANGSNVHNGGLISGGRAPSSNSGGKSNGGFSGYAPGMAKSGSWPSSSTNSGSKGESK